MTIDMMIMDNTGDNCKKYEKFKNIHGLDINLNIVNNFRDVLDENSKKIYDLIIFKVSKSDDIEFLRVKDILKASKRLFIMYDYFDGIDGAELKLRIEKLLNNNNRKSRDKRNLIIIGSSTGGPKALQNVIPKLPSTINGIIVIVQHMPPKFTKSLAVRLDRTSALKVKEAKEGEKLEKGTVYIAPGDNHLLVFENNNNIYVELNKDDKHLGLRPAVDMLMQSAVNISSYNKVGVILTGMGSDGALGLESLKNSNSYNIVQDEKSSVIYGMPRAAIETGLVDRVVKLDNIAVEIIDRVGC